MQKLFDGLPHALKTMLEMEPGIERCEEVHLRAGQPLEVRIDGAGRLIGSARSVDDIRALVAALTRHSLYAREEDMKHGFFTLAGGYRVGLTGRYVIENGEIRSLTHIGSLCIRMAREIKGAADAVMPKLIAGGTPISALIVSPPGMGKTTMLRDIARQLSLRGFRVAISDERSELAGCIDGIPTMDLGPRTDVADGLPKRKAIPQLLRAMSPDVIVTDELGHAGDADAVYDAVRSGVSVVASAHGRRIEDVANRPAIMSLIKDALFDPIIILGGKPGHVESIVHPRTEVTHQCIYGQ